MPPRSAEPITPNAAVRLLNTAFAWMISACTTDAGTLGKPNTPTTFTPRKMEKWATAISALPNA